jgi:hypothetical protein
MPKHTRPPLASISLALLSTFLLVPEHLCITRHLTVHDPATPSLGIGQNARAQSWPGHASTRAHRALAAPVRRALERRRPPLAKLPLRRASTPRPLHARQTPRPAPAPSPSSSSLFCRTLRRRHWMRSSHRFTLWPRQLHVEHRQDTS